MKVRLRDLRKIIRDVAEEAPKGSPLGRFAFPAQRKDMPLEPDTKEEKRLYRVLSRHFLDNVDIGKEDTALIRGFLEAGIYSAVFKAPPAGTTLYRGMGVTMAWLAKKTGLSKEKIADKRKGVTAVKMTYEPEKGSSSWTTSKKVAYDHGYDGEVQVILHASADENPGAFVMGPGGLYDVNPFGDFKHEKEALGLGPVAVFKVTWEV